MNNIFEKMKSQMAPSDAVIYDLKFNLEKQKKKAPMREALSWIPAAASCALAALCIVNAAMPTSAENIPLAGRFFAFVNNLSTGNDTEEKAPLYALKDPEKATEINVSSKSDGLVLTLAEAHCDGLDLSVAFTLADTKNVIPEDCKSLTLSRATAQIGNNIFYPTAHSPILYRSSDGTYAGYGTFNVGSVTLTDGDLLNVKVTVPTLSGYKDGLTYAESLSYTFGEDFEIAYNIMPDLENYQVIKIGETHGDVTLEKVIISDTRMDVVVKASKDMKYPNALSVKKTTSYGTSALVYSGGNSVWELDGSYTYYFNFEAPSNETVAFDIEFISDATGFDACEKFTVDLGGEN